MSFDLTGRRALVMGSTKGLGFGIAKAFAGAGAHVTITGRTAEAAAKSAATLGRNATGVALDTGDFASIDSVAQSMKGGVDILVLNGGGPPGGPALGVASEMWQKQWNAMFVGLVRMADHLIPGMAERKFGRVISIVSSSVIQPIPNLGISNSIRPALIGWGKTVSNEVAKHGVTVNAIAPGRIQTDRIGELDGANANRQGKDVEQVRADAITRIPVGRYGSTDEFGAAALFLASNEASFTTGSVIRVDGGQISSL
jgi:3-oxoacyl-[acyl-carrier protein] reductase